MRRLCSRSACGAPAAATLAYDYEHRTVWLDDIAPGADKTPLELCTDHADGLRVPRGWACEDRRSGTQPLFHPPIAV